MRQTFPRSDQRHLYASRTAVDGACPSCRAERLEEYRVLSDGGWFDVCKCRECLTSVRRVPAPPFGSYRPYVFAISDREVPNAQR